MRTTSFPDASVQAPRVGRIQAMQASDATGQKCRRAGPDCSTSDFPDRSSPESGSPSERADGPDPAALTEWPQMAFAALLQAVLP